MSAAEAAPEQLELRLRTMGDLQKVRERNHLTLVCALQKRIVKLLDDDPSAAVELLHAYNGITAR